MIRGHLKKVTEQESAMVRIILEIGKKGIAINLRDVLENVMNYTLKSKMANDGNFVFTIIIYIYKL